MLLGLRGFLRVIQGDCNSKLFNKMATGKRKRDILRRLSWLVVLLLEMRGLIEAQCAFVGGRQFIDVAPVANEIVDDRRRRGRKGFYFHWILRWRTIGLVGIFLIK